MNTLYGLPAGAGLRQGSPWVMKVQLAMRYLKIDYDLKPVSYTHLTLPTTEYV